MFSELLNTLKLIFGFLPWIMFLFLPTNGWDQLRRAVLLCLIMSIILAWKELRKGFILQWASLLFFLFCVVSFYGFKWIWLAKHMGIIANSFLIGVIWFTVLIDKPFTLQYARADLPKERWNDQDLICGCRFIAIFWGVVLSIPTVFNIFRLFYPIALPDCFNLFLNLFCMIVGLSYTVFYKRKKRKQREARLHD